MRSRTRFQRPIVMAIVIAGLTGTSLAAQSRLPRPGDVEVGIDLGASRFGVGQPAFPTGTRISLFLAHYLTRHLGWGLDIVCLGGSDPAATAGTGSGFTLCTGSVGALLAVPVSARVAPYLRVSVGQAQLDRDAQKNVFDIDKRSGAAQASIGSRIALGRTGRFAVRAEASWLRTGALEGWGTHRSGAVGVVYRVRRQS
jgi:hypothetical protein